MSLRLILNYGRPHNLSTRGGNTRPRGGIVTALHDLGQALAARGHDVHVFAPLHEDGSRAGGVTYHDRSTFAGFTRSSPPDVLVLVPELAPVLMPVEARARVVWSGNAHTGGDCALVVPWAWAPQLGPRGHRARLYPMGILQRYVDRLAMKSRWQAGYVGQAQGIPAEKFVVLYNGVRLGLFAGPEPERHDRRLVYTSQARRGLDVLLELFPAIRAQVPGTELHVFGYEYRNEGKGGVAAQADQPGVVWRGTVGKADLARELRSATLMTYPCTFKETFCTAVAEAQAAGLPVVASDNVALSERVSDGVDGFLISGLPLKPAGGPSPAIEPAFREGFVDAVVQLLRDEELRHRFGAAAAAKACVDYDWDRIVAQWDALLTELAAQAPRKPAIDPSLDLLDPSLLRIEDLGASANVPAELAERWLRAEWASYGFDPTEVPGLP